MVQKGVLHLACFSHSRSRSFSDLRPLPREVAWLVQEIDRAAFISVMRGNTEIEMGAAQEPIRGTGLKTDSIAEDLGDARKPHREYRV